jgi:hypothetical protein
MCFRTCGSVVNTPWPLVSFRNRGLLWISLEMPQTNRDVQIQLVQLRLVLAFVFQDGGGGIAKIAHGRRRQRPESKRGNGSGGHQTSVISARRGSHFLHLDGITRMLKGDRLSAVSWARRTRRAAISFCSRFWEWQTASKTPLHLWPLRPRSRPRNNS